MAKGLQLTLVIHNHQPVGNFGHVFEEACDKAYLPFLRMLAQHPRVRVGLHTSGCLWEWLEANRPEYGELVAELLKRDQLELVSGGMYEPILPVLPKRDAVWQLKRMNRFLEDRFGVSPEGMWCPERVWEPHLPGIVHAGGLKYTLLDDTHFQSSVLPEQIATEYFVTDHGTSSIALFPISKKLRYTMPFKPVPDTFTYLYGLMQQAQTTPLAVFGDDGEKFGVWPETYEWVYERGWMSDFMTALTESMDWIELLLPGEVLAKRLPAATVYIPCASYAEMGEWTRVDPEAKEGDPPGFWRNFMHKYPESHAMYRRMLLVSDMLEQARHAGASESDLAGAQDDLGRGQCNCAYWHGVFGGLYLNYLRQAVYHHLIKAERSIRHHLPEAGRAVRPVKWSDFSGEIFQLFDGTVSAVVDQRRGMCITQLDYIPTAFCWSDVLARRREAYHAKLDQAGMQAEAAHASIHDRVVLKEEGLQELLAVDAHERVNFNCFFGQLDSLDQLMHRTSAGNQPMQRLYDDYTLASDDAVAEEHAVRGSISCGRVKLLKSIELVPGGLEMHTTLAKGGLAPEPREFFVEFNLTVLTDHSDDRYLEANGLQLPLHEALVLEDTAELCLVDGWQQRRLRLQAPGAARLICYPIYTVSSSEGGFERTYQGSCILASYNPLALLEGIKLSLLIEEI